MCKLTFRIVELRKRGSVSQVLWGCKIIKKFVATSGFRSRLSARAFFFVPLRYIFNTMGRWSEFWSMRRREVRGTLVLLLLAIVAMVVAWCVRTRRAEMPATVPAQVEAVMREGDSVRAASVTPRKGKQHRYKSRRDTTAHHKRKKRPSAPARATVPQRDLMADTIASF